VAASAQAWPPTWFCSTRKGQDTAIKLLSSAEGIDYVIVNGQLANLLTSANAKFLM
jgi:hypothetical protein